MPLRVREQSFSSSSNHLERVLKASAERVPTAIEEVLVRSLRDLKSPVLQPLFGNETLPDVSRNMIRLAKVCRLGKGAKALVVSPRRDQDRKLNDFMVSNDARIKTALLSQSHPVGKPTWQVLMRAYYRWSEEAGRIFGVVCA